MVVVRLSILKRQHNLVRCVLSKAQAKRCLKSYVSFLLYSMQVLNNQPSNIDIDGILLIM